MLRFYAGFGRSKPLSSMPTEAVGPIPGRLRVGSVHMAAGLSIGEDMVVRHGRRTYKELNEGIAGSVIWRFSLAFPAWATQRLKGRFFRRCAPRADEDRQDAVATLLETATRELVIVLTGM